MSYILDALKKIEHEKNRKPAANGRVSISGDLFHERIQAPARTGIWKVVALIAVAILMAGGAAWFMLQGNDKKNSSIIRQASPVSVFPVKPSPPLPTSTQQTTPPLAPALVAPKVVPKNIEESDDSSPNVVRSKKERKAKSIGTQTAAQTVQAPADIKLSGIAWQDQHSGRRAVVNGFLLKEGDVVSGAKISEIHADRVRFSVSTGAFELKLDAVLPAEGKR
jgi:hypothetical protein